IPSRKPATPWSDPTICSILTPSTPGAPWLRRTRSRPEKHGYPGSQHIHPIDPVVQYVKSELRFPLGLLAQLLSQLRNFRRQSWLFHRFRHRLSRGCPSLRSGIFIQAVFSSSYRFMLSVRPLRSTGITPLPRSYGPLRLPSGPPRRLCIPAGRWSLSLPPCRASQAPRLIFPRALPPTTPESPAGACLLLPPGIRLHPSGSLQDIGRYL